MAMTDSDSARTVIPPTSNSTPTPPADTASAADDNASATAAAADRLAAMSLSEEEAQLVDKRAPALAGGDRDRTLSVESVARWHDELLKDPKNLLAIRAISQNGPGAILTSPSSKITTPHIFNTKIPTEGAPITNQRSSGRCWLFAATNVFRVALMKRYNLDAFELSQQYLYFWDKFEKANWVLEHAIDTAKSEEVGGRLVQALLSAPVGDGGQWDMLANIVEKYGIVPQSVYPDSFNAKASAVMNRLVTAKLREDVLVLRKLVLDGDSKEALQATKEKFLNEIYNVMVICMTAPPSATAPFTWDFYDKDKKFQSVSSTPLAFASQLSAPAFVADAMHGTNVRELFSLVNDPRNEYNRLLTVDRLGNVVGGRPVTYVNVDMPTMKAAAIAMLRAGIPVFFGCDVGKAADRKSGIMDAQLFDYELGFNVALGMSKAERLVTGESAMTHAMVLTAVHLDEGGRA
ncbi:deoxyhypusine hydroxylase, partial [Ascosphaera pollenicola]